MNDESTTRNPLGLHDPLREEIRALVVRLAGDAAAVAELARLNELLASSRQACRWYLEEFDVVGLLCWSNHQAAEAALASELGDLQVAPPTAASFWALPRRVSAWSLALSVLIAATVLYGGFSLLVWSMSFYNRAEYHGQLASDDNVPAAGVQLLSQSDDCRWRQGDFARDREHYRLESGQAKLQLDCGTLLCLQGRSDLQLLDANSVRLSAGLLVVRVPKNAVGFEVLTPSARVIDLGTEFGVEVDACGNTEVHVLTGAVETIATGASSPSIFPAVRLSTGEALRIDHAGKVVDLPAADNRKFEVLAADAPNSQAAPAISTYTDLILADRPIAYWPLQDDTGSAVVVDRSGKGHTGTLRGSVQLGLPGPPLAARGVANETRCAQLNGTSWIEIANPNALNLTAGFTVEAWLRPGNMKDIGRVLSIDPESNKHGWGFGCLPQAQFDADRPGLLFTLYGQKDYPLVPPGDVFANNDWRHIAVVCDTGFKAYLFVDGKAVARGEGNTAGVAGDVKAAIGRQNNGTQFYVGEIAHLAVYSRMLSERTIASRYSWAADATGNDTTSQDRE